MHQVAHGIYIFEGLRVSNVYMLVTGEALSLVDSGLRSDVDKIVFQIQESGYKLRQLKTIILTHAHFDHTGGAPMLSTLSGAKVIAHKQEVPFIEKTKSLPAKSSIQRMLNWMTEKIMFRQSGLYVDIKVEDGQELDVLGGLSVVHTPGHTPGSISLFYAEQGVLFCGDALFNAHPVTRKPGLQFPLDVVSVDSNQARVSVKKLSRLQVKVLCCGHGEPMMDAAWEKIMQLLDEKMEKRV